MTKLEGLLQIKRNLNNNFSPCDHLNTPPNECTGCVFKTKRGVLTNGNSSFCWVSQNQNTPVFYFPIEDIEALINKVSYISMLKEMYHEV
jgi:hypothetical protein